MLVKICVIKFGSDGVRKELYRNSLDLSDGLRFDFDGIYKVMRTLYPSSDAVEFTVF